MELAPIAYLWREPVVLAYHRKELVILANQWREGNFPALVELILTTRNLLEKYQKPSKGAL
jgi:hypothetical protein